MKTLNNGFKLKSKRTGWLLAFLLFSIVCFGVSFFPQWVPSLIFLSLGIPLIVFCHVVLVVIFLIQRSGYLLFPITGLAAAFFLTEPIFVLHPSTTPKGDEISVLSFNAKFFRNPGTYQRFSSEMIRWVVEDTSKIKCFQEYSTNPSWMGLDVTGKLEKNGYSGFVVKSTMKNNDHSNGLAIFSKYRIIRSGSVIEPDSTSNGVIFADLDVGRDTIRVFNVHLASMNLNDGNYLSKISAGSERRIQQIRPLVAAIRICPYPIIMVGDFNEIPNSFVYRRIKSLLANSFEKSGAGFGFTYNGPMFFLRIDHQFSGAGGYSKKSMETSYYRVERSMNISDHFPTFGYYRVSRAGL